MKKEFLIAISYIVEADEELIEQSEKDKHPVFNINLDNYFPRQIKFNEDILAKWTCSTTVTLESKSNNSVKCECCGTWVTQRDKPDALPLSRAEYIDEKIYCVECADNIRSGINCRH